MTKKAFKNGVIEPLKKEFNIKIYFNGKKARELELDLPSRKAMGACRLDLKYKPCTIRWGKDINETYQTLFHEVAHAVLHGKGSKFRGGYDIKEIEAESVAKIACNMLNLTYEKGFKGDKSTDYIEYYQEEYMKTCTRLKIKQKQPRKDLIQQTADRIVGTLKGIKTEQ
jgi:hypothetical protein